MPEVVAAYGAYKQSERDAIALRTRGRARLGQAVNEYRKAKGLTQQEVAGALGVVVEQVRRYEAAYRDWLRDHDGQAPA